MIGPVPVHAPGLQLTALPTAALPSMRGDCVCEGWGSDVSVASPTGLSCPVLNSVRALLPSRLATATSWASASLQYSLPAAGSIARPPSKPAPGRSISTCTSLPSTLARLIVSRSPLVRCRFSASQ